ncbi:hypothetical protein [Hyalangium rubrum]|uniref:HEAT repeat domain-containing protein n=1 Tax=Hyalangium rubrum TaxID=3103134 RepID=A0ABU5HEG9_9BACT|nr:hypothetical protein [Hyalangium sp. s54d21]MDY7231519.1 hypothetical protein [Hyalangium sp. s54d21]
MRLKDAQALVDRCFAGVAHGAPRLHEPEDPRFSERPSAVWLEYRWYVHERGLAELFLKWPRVPVAQCPEAEISVVRVHLLGDSPELATRARGLLEGGTPSQERILGLFGGDGVERECVSLGATSVTLEHWAKAGPRELLDAERFLALSGTLSSPDSTPEERHEAVQRISDERSERVVAVLLGLLEQRSSLMALRVLSEWGVTQAREPLRRALEAVAPDNPADLWALTALDRRLEAWEAVARLGGEGISPR